MADYSSVDIERILLIRQYTLNKSASWKVWETLLLLQTLDPTAHFKFHHMQSERSFSVLILPGLGPCTFGKRLHAKSGAAFFPV